MKKVIAGCIDLMLEFDSASELDCYIADIEAKKQEYSIVDRKELPGDRIMIRIHRQYNKSPWGIQQLATGYLLRQNALVTVHYLLVITHISLST